MPSGRDILKETHMRSIKISLIITAAVLGLVATTPSPVAAQSPQFFMRGRMFGPFARVNIFAPFTFRLTVDPRGPAFGFTQQFNFAPAFRGSFSPFGQTAI